ncbi:MAG: ATP-binding protein, partial [Bacteroidota bacterium]
HDLRAPLRAIDSFSRILMDEEIEHLSTEGKRQLSTIRMNTVRMSRLIDDLLEFSRLSRSELQKIHFNMEVVVKTIAREAINAEPLRSFELSIHPMPKAFGDPSLMRQVLSNLIGNAVKFTKNCAVAKIEIGGIESEHDISYYVKDNGAGFDMKYADKLFGVFQRLHTLSEFEGTGVGLAIVHRIIHRHGGTIQPFGEVGNGAILHLRYRSSK